MNVFEQIQQAAINLSGSGIIVPGVPGKITEIIQAVLIGAGSTVTFLDGETALSGPMAIAAGVPLILPPNKELGWYRTTPGNDLSLDLSANSQATGTIWFIQYKA